MLRRCLPAFVVALLIGSPAVAAEPPAKAARPAVVVQLQPVNRLVGELKELVRLAAGPKNGDDAVKQFLMDLEDTLGAKGFEGVDINRPLAAYAFARETAADCSAVLVLPYTSEKDFLDLLDRLKFKVEPVPGKKDLYKVATPDEESFENDSYLRFADGWAYLNFNGEDVLDAANLVPIAALIDPRETAQVVVRFHPDRFPEKLVGDGLDAFAEIVDLYKMILTPDDKQHLAKGMDAAAEQALKLIRRHAEPLRKDGKDAVLRYAVDPLTGDQSFEFTLTPKPGSALAKDIAALKPSPNRFAGMARQLAGPAVTVAGRLPFAVPEVRDMAVALGEMFETEAAAELPEPLRPLAVELLKGLARTAKKGDADFAAALLGPNKSKRFTMGGAVAFDDPAAVEKALRDGVKNPLLRKILKLDAAKAGELSVHTLAVGEFLDEDFQKLFGKDAVLCLAFGKDAVYASFGPLTESLAAIRSAVAYAPPAGAATGRYLEVEGNIARLGKLVTALYGEPDGTDFKELMGREDRLVPFAAISVQGGDTLVIRYQDNVKYLFRSVFTGGAAIIPAAR